MFTLILTIQSSHKDGGIAMHSIDFNDVNGAYNAGEKWRESLRHQSVIASYVVVEKP